MPSSSSPPPPPPPLSRNPDSKTSPSSHKNKKSQRFISLPNLKLRSQPQESCSQIPSLSPLDPARLITLDSTSLDTADTLTDKYKWAVVYENQRGMTLFSIPYYSQMSLLPSDPPPFTIPNVVSTSSKQTNISLDDYPLPDGTWRWVSKCWMIDMRSDTGEVQHDGFEYNWMFRTHKWRAEVGSFSAGGWVRRRRWIRLMVRPARPSHLINHEHEGRSMPSVSVGTDWPTSPIGSSLSLSVKALDASATWTEDDVDGNWLKCRSLMKSLGRDGRKIEIWKTWLANTHPSGKTNDAKGKAPETGDGSPLAAPTERDLTFENLQIPPREFLVSILRKFGTELLRSFVYPDSRAKFLELLAEEELLYALDVELSTAIPGSGMDFWSYVDSPGGVDIRRHHLNQMDFIGHMSFMKSRSWISSPPVQAALRTYILSLSLSLGPSLVPFLTAFIAAKSSNKTSLHALRRVLLRELGFGGFAFAMTVAVGGGSVLRDLWRIYDNRRKNLESKRKDLFEILSPSQRTFIAYMMSSTLGILLLQAGRQRFHRSRRVPVPTAFAPPPKSDVQISNTLDLTLLLLVRAVDCLVQNFIRTATLSQDNGCPSSDESKKQGVEKTVRALTSRVDAFVFWACSSRIMWCFFYEPQRCGTLRLFGRNVIDGVSHRLPKSYVKWIATLANLDGRVIQTLRLLREGRWSYIHGSAEHSGILRKFSQELGHNPSWGDPRLLPAYGGAAADAVWKSLDVRNRHGVGGLPCQLVHGSVGASLGLNVSCTANSIIRGSMAFLEAIAIYLPVHFLPLILTHPQSVFKPQRAISTLCAALRSATFLSTFVTLYWSAVCVTRSLVFARFLPQISHDFWDGPMGCIFAGSLMCGSSIWVENGRRRGEMALYVLPRAVRACLPDALIRTNGRNVRFVERLFFVLSFSTLVTAAIHRPDTLRGLSRWTLSFILKGPRAGFWKRKQQDPDAPDTPNGPLVHTEPPTI